MKKFLFFIFTAIMLLISDASPGWADGELLPLIWRRDGLTYERICKQGKLVIMSSNSSVPNVPCWNLIDLKDGTTIYQTDPNTEHGMFTNYNGDKYYVLNYIENQWKEYDVKTKKFIRNTYGADYNTNNGAHYLSSDSVYVEFRQLNHSLLFKNVNTGILLDSFKIPGTPDQPYYSLASGGFEFSNNGRYYTFSLNTWDKPYTKRFYVYDRVKREIIFDKSVNPYYKNYRHSFFNKSNLMAYAEEMKLPGDDTVYSYIRIFDPEQRKVVRDIKIDKLYIDGFILSQDDKKIIYQLNEYFDPNKKRIYDLENDKKINRSFLVYGGGLLIADSTILYTYGEGVYAEVIDWTADITDKPVIQIEQTLYPNPTTGSVNIKLNSKFLNGNWILNNLTGAQIRQGLIGDTDMLKLNLSDLQTNTYYLTLLKGKERETYRIIKK